MGRAPEEHETRGLRQVPSLIALGSHWLPLFGYLGLIYYLSSLSNPLPQLQIWRWDKLAHFSEYAGLGLLLCRALSGGGPGLSSRSALLATFALGALYGVSDEIHQIGVPSRVASVGDAAMDGLGSLAGALAFAYALRRSGRRSRVAAAPQRSGA